MRRRPPQAPKSLSISSSASPRNSDSIAGPRLAAPSRSNIAVNSWFSSPTACFTRSLTSPSVVRLSNSTTRITRRAMSARYIDSRSPWWNSAPNSGSPSMRASWSLALKSAAVREAKAVGSNTGASPTVATSCPVRSTINAVRALASRRKRVRIAWRRCASSSRNDQLEAPPLTAAPSFEGCLHPANEGLGPAAEHRLGLPGEVVPEQSDRLHPLLPREEAERAEAPERLVAEQVLAVTGEAILGEEPAGHHPGQGPAGEDRGAAAHQDTSCRALKACASLTPSTYSRSPPIGRPRASRVTRGPSPESSCWIYVAVTSPSIEGLVARITSRTAPLRTRSTRRSSRSASGPTPSSGESRPPRTWYRPRNSVARSTTLTAEASSTTHSSAASRRGSRQMAHGCSSVGLPHCSHGRTRSATHDSAAASRPACSGECCSRW